MRILWMDCETGGLEPDWHEMLTIAGIIEIDKKVVDEFYFKIRPNFPKRLEPSALKVNGLTYTEVMDFEYSGSIYHELKRKFIKYGLRNDRLIVAGHNVASFDRKFLDKFFEYHNCKTLHYWLSYHSLDTMSVAAWLKYVGKLDIDSLKLTSLCQYFNIELKAHDALEDIRATKQLAIELQKLISK